MPAIERRIINIMSGRQSGPLAVAVRAMMGVSEPIYAGVVRLRNWTFDAGFRRSHEAARPVISVGNLTTGGTGKTPVVGWIAQQLLARGHRPAVLLRGYRSAAGISDEASLLQELVAPAAVIPNPDRVAGAVQALIGDSTVDCFILDDGFQHRRLARAIDVVLIDATEPFGFDHVLPRGMLREPLCELRRCDCVIVTRCENANQDTLQAIHNRVRKSAQNVIIVHCFMVLDHFVDQDDRSHPIGEGGDSFAVCGIGNPENFLSQLSRESGLLTGSHIFADHHNYTRNDIDRIVQEAGESAAKRVVTTEKDWIKLRKFGDAWKRLPIWRAILRVEFSQSDSQSLIEHIESKLNDSAKKSRTVEG